MANIKFEKVVLHHFMSYDHTEFILDRQGYIFISGVNNNDSDNAKSNGSGKSSLFSALCWCLTGETPNGGKRVENIFLSGQCYVELYFSILDNHYMIKRSKNPSNLSIIINGEDKSGKGIRDGEKLLSEYIPDVTSSLINSVIILGQGLPKRFTNNSPSGRKEVLEKLSNSDFMIDDIKTRLNKRISFLEDTKNKYSEMIIKSESDIEHLNTSISNNKQKLDNIDEYKLEQELDLLRLNKNALNEDIGSYIAAKEEIDSQLSSLINKLTTISSDYNEEYKKINFINTDDIQDKLNNLKLDLKIKETKIKELDSVTDICPTCGQKLPNVVKLDTTELKQECISIRDNISILEAEFNTQNKFNETLIQDLDNEYKTKKEEISSNISVLKSDSNNYSNIINDKTLKLKEVLEEIISLETKLNFISSLKEELLNSISSDKDAKLKLENELTNTQILLTDTVNRLDILNKINSIVKRDLRGYLLKNIILFISNKVKEYSKIVFNSYDLTFELDGNNILISYDGKDYESLSGGEKQKVDIIIQFAIRDMLCNYLNFSSNILVLDEITDSLDITGSQSILNLISSELSDVESIYIISHHSDFSIPWDEEILVAKDNNKISRIVS